MIQISFRTRDPNIRQAQSGIRVKKLRLIHDPLGLQNPQIRSIYRTNPQSVLFQRPDPPIRKPIHPPHLGNFFFFSSRYCGVFEMEMHYANRSKCNISPLK